MALSRHQYRVIAFQTIFALDFIEDNKTNELFAMLLDGQAQDDYVILTVNSVHDLSDQLDASIEKYLASGWTIGRIAKVPLNILRLSIYEMTMRVDIPIKVAINEGLELAKEFGDEFDYKFINGVLSKVQANGQ